MQCLPGSYSSAPTRGTSLSLAPNSLFIPNDQLSHDAKQLNGYKYVVPGKSDMKKNPFPAVSREQLQLDSSSDSVKQETKSHKETSGTASKGKVSMFDFRHLREMSEIPVAKTLVGINCLIVKHGVHNPMLSVFRIMYYHHRGLGGSRTKW